MRVRRNALLCLAAVATLTFAAADTVFAQKIFSRGPSANVGSSLPRGPKPNIGTNMPRGGGGYPGGVYQGGGYGLGVAVPGVLMTLPQTGPRAATCSSMTAPSTTGRAAGRRSARAAAARAACHPPMSAG